jgi:hypothetical protein
MNVDRFLRVPTLWAKPNRLTVKFGLFCSMLFLLAFIPQPNITTNQNGKANVSFYTSIKGAYTIKISGVDVTGGIGDGTFKLNQIKHENP